ncbi:MAG: hypothetical protein V4664_00510 [Patescibacteria group bacterium]
MKRSYTTNWPRACEVFDKLIGQLRGGEHPFDHSKAPQIDENMPANLSLAKDRGEGDRKKHALFLWMSCYYMRGGIDSEVAFRRLTLIHERKPYLFDPAWIKKHVAKKIAGGQVPYSKRLVRHLKRHAVYKELSRELSAHGLGFSLHDNTRFWILNAVKMENFWHGDPRELFHWVVSYDDLVGNIANKKKFSMNAHGGFLGFQEKMVSMISYFLASTDLVDRHTIPVPVDFHVLRMLLANEIIVPHWKVKPGKSIFSPKLLEVAREVTHRYCQERRVEMIELCDALWLFSRSMCSWHPDNISKTPDKSYQRKQQQKLRMNPLRVLELTSVGRPTEALSPDKEVGLGRKSRVVHTPPVWTSSQLAAYDRSCRMCKLEKTCKRAIPAAPYYLSGQVHLRNRTFPEGKPTLLDMAEVPIRVNVIPWDKEGTRKAAEWFLDEENRTAPVEDQQSSLDLVVEENRSDRRQLIKLTDV